MYSWIAWRRWVKINYPSHAPVLVLEEEGKLAEVRFWTNQGCQSFQSTCSALSKYCKFCASITSFGEELYRSITSYNNLSPFLAVEFCPIKPHMDVVLHFCCPFHLLSFPFLIIEKLIWASKQLDKCLARAAIGIIKVTNPISPA